MVDVDHNHPMTLFIDAVADPVFASHGAPKAFERRTKSYADNPWPLKEWAGNELPGCKSDRRRKVLTQRPPHTW
jgi:hypothetical protein